MQRLLLFAALTVASILPASGQESTGARVPIVVKRFALKNQTSALGSSNSPVPLFTPDHDGIYRLTVLVQSVGKPQTTCTNQWCIAVFVNYLNPANSPLFPGFGLGGSSNDVPSAATAFILKAGVPLGYFSEIDPLSVNPYNFFIVMEEL
jgi:hypothetical protein